MGALLALVYLLGVVLAVALFVLAIFAPYFLYSCHVSARASLKHLAEIERLLRGPIDTAAEQQRQARWQALEEEKRQNAQRAQEAAVTTEAAKAQRAQELLEKKRRERAERREAETAHECEVSPPSGPPNAAGPWA